jgi:SAM-dependent methyltransferase
MERDVLLWNNFWKTQGLERTNSNSYLDSERNKKILEIIKNPTERNPNEFKILEIGCGPAINLSYFAKLGYLCCGVDYSKEAISLTENSEAAMFYADARDLPFKSDSFDLVYSAGLLEHYMKEEKLLKEMKRVCKPNSKVIVTVPNLLHLWTVIKKFKNNLFKREKTYFPESLENLLKSIGLKKVSVNGICAGPFPGLITELDSNEVITKYFGVELVGSGIK